MYQLFFELIRVAIGTQDSLSRLPSAREWGKLYKLAEKQSLLGVCFAGLQNLGADAHCGFAGIGMSEMQYLTWMGVAASIQSKNETVNRHCVELQSRIAESGCRSYIMKGQSNAALYGELSLLRQSGDIDVYIEGGLEKVLACAEKFGGATGVNELEMQVKVFEDTEVEFHYRPFIMRNPWKNKRLQAFFKSREEACLGNRIKLGGMEPASSPAGCLEITAPTVEFDLVHQMAHIHLHLFTEGVGLRQLMDFFFVLRSCGSDDGSPELAEVRRVIRDLGLERFASAVMWVMGHVFGLAEEEMLWEPDGKDGRFLLGEVMASGNFGQHDKEQRKRKAKAGYGLWALLIRNLRLMRFDRGDWFWGPLWRVYHFVWRKLR